MLTRKLATIATAIGMLLATGGSQAQAQSHKKTSTQYKHVLLISIDGMHSVDFTNCANGVSNSGNQPPNCRGCPSDSSRIARVRL